METPVTVIGGDPRLQRISIDGVEYIIRPIAMGDFPALMTEGGAAIDVLLDASGTNVNWRGLLVTHNAQVIAAVAIAARIPREVVAGLGGEAFIQLASIVLALNMDFFVQRVRPALGNLLLQIGRLGAKASAETSTTARSH